MSKSTEPKSLLTALGAGLALSLSCAPLAQASENPFGAKFFAAGTQVAAEHACGARCWRRWRPIGLMASIFWNSRLKTGWVSGPVGSAGCGRSPSECRVSRTAFRSIWAAPHR